MVHLGGKCIHVLGGAWNKPKDDQPLVTYEGCGQSRLQFVLTSDGLLKLSKFGQCVRPAGGRTADGTFVSRILTYLSYLFLSPHFIISAYMVLVPVASVDCSFLILMV